MHSEVPFDAVACDYDAAFTNTAVGRLLRERVWQIFGDLVICEFRDSSVSPPNHQITKSPIHQALELNCGTGEDAIWLARQGCQVLATDISPEMIEAARMKATVQLSESSIRFQVCNFAEIGRFSGQQFDLVFSNFGGLNCASPEELRQLAFDLQKLIAPGGLFVAVVMSRFCWQETLYFLLKGKPREAFRRLSRKSVSARLDEKMTVPTWYYSPSEFQRLFCTTDLQIRRPSRSARRICKSVVQKPVGFWLPPSYLNPFFEKRPRLLRVLNFLEKNCTPAWFAPAADHFLICLEKMADE